MKRVLLLTFVGVLVICVAQCGSFFVGGAIQNGTATIHGSVTNVQLDNVVGSSGETLQVTFVTFVHNGLPTTIGFCNNQTTQFLLNQSVSVNFNPGQFCATLVVVVIA